MMLNVDANMTTTYTAPAQSAAEAMLAAPPVAPMVETEKSARSNQQENEQQNKQDDKAEETKGLVLAEVVTDNRPVQVIKRELSFSLSQSEDRVVIEVIDAENDEVIRRIPADELSKLEETLGSLKGLFVDSSA